MNLEEKRGVLVTRIEPGSFAEELGLQERDIIVSINRQPVAATEDVRRLQQGLKPGDPIAFRIMRANAAPRGGKQQWQTITLAEKLPAAEK